MVTEIWTFFFIWLYRVAYRILVLQPGIEPQVHSSESAES